MRPGHRARGPAGLSWHRLSCPRRAGRRGAPGLPRQGQAVAGRRPLHAHGLCGRGVPSRACSEACAAGSAPGSIVASSGPASPSARRVFPNVRDRGPAQRGLQRGRPVAAQSHCAWEPSPPRSEARFGCGVWGWRPPGAAAHGNPPSGRPASRAARFGEDASRAAQGRDGQAAPLGGHGRQPSVVFDSQGGGGALASRTDDPQRGARKPRPRPQQLRAARAEPGQHGPHQAMPRLFGGPGPAR